MTAVARILAPDGAAFDRRDFDAIAKIVHSHAGIVLSAEKTTLVRSRLGRLLRDAGAASFADYVALVGEDAEERDRMVEALTTNHTKFFREEHHFEHFARELRPTLLRRIVASEPVRLWSAGSSSGEEVYSLAMTLLGSDAGEARSVAGGNVALLATDIASHVLRTARAGVYSAASAQDIPAALRERWTQAAGRDVQIAEPARRLVRFRQLNLLEPWPISGRFDAIFCRNTMIYFDAPTRDRLLARFADALLPGGTLYIGHSERLSGPAAAQMRLVGPTTFRKAAA